VRHPAPDAPAPPATTDAFTQAFDEAIAPWQAGNYAEAALRLEALAQRFPDDADAQFYLGTAWLLAGVAPDAVAPLRRAVALAPPSLAAEASWYLGLALHDLGRHADGRRALEDACRGGHPHACRALTQRRATQ
jgi:TolA-binding protein